MWTKVISEFPWGEVIILIYLSYHSSIQQQQKKLHIPCFKQFILIWSNLIFYQNIILQV